MRVNRPCLAAVSGLAAAVVASLFLVAALVHPRHAHAQAAQVTGDETLPVNSDISLDQIMEQLLGDYSVLNNAAGPLAGGAIQESWDHAGPTAGVLHVLDPEGKTIKVILRVGMPLTITLPDGQIIADYILGDQVNFDTRECPNVPGCIWVWSKAAGFDSLLSIVSDGGLVFPIYIRGEGVSSKNIPHTWLRYGARGPKTGVVVRPAPGPGPVFGSSSDTPVSELSSPEGDNGGAGVGVGVADVPIRWTRHVTFDPGTIRHDLVMTGDAEIAPVTVWRDNWFTWLDWGEDHDLQRWPVAFEVVDGIDQPVRVRKTKNNRFLIVETTGPITLRRGEKVVCIRRKEYS